jgi:hypothetical protein
MRQSGIVEDASVKFDVNELLGFSQVAKVSGGRAQGGANLSRLLSKIGEGPSDDFDRLSVVDRSDLSRLFNNDGGEDV